MLILQNVTISRVFASQIFTTLVVTCQYVRLDESDVYQIPEIHIIALILRGDVSKESDKAKKIPYRLAGENEVFYLSGVSARG